MKLCMHLLMAITRSGIPNPIRVSQFSCTIFSELNRNWPKFTKFQPIFWQLSVKLEEIAIKLKQRCTECFKVTRTSDRLAQQSFIRKLDRNAQADKSNIHGDVFQGFYVSKQKMVFSAWFLQTTNDLIDKCSGFFGFEFFLNQFLTLTFVLLALLLQKPLTRLGKQAIDKNLREQIMVSLFTKLQTSTIFF